MLVDEHSRCKTRQASVVKMCSTPIILVASVRTRLRFLRIVVQQTCFSCAGGTNDMLEISSRITRDILLRKAIACASD
jgi:hypothetical protein